MNFKHIKQFLSVLLLPIACVGPMYSFANWEHNIKYYHYYVPSLGPSVSIGDIYSTDKDTFVPLSCLNMGEPRRTGDNRGELNITDEMSFEELKKYFQLDFEGDAAFKWFSTDIVGKFVRDTVETEYDRIFTYRINMRFKDLTFTDAPDTEPYLNRRGRTMWDRGLAAFRDSCGDRFVIQQERGADLIIRVKMQFYSYEDKREFSTSIGVNIPLVNLVTKIQENSNHIRKKSNISIQALQIGGDPRQLGRILGGDGDDPAPILECGIDDLDKCTKMLGAVVRYATVPNTDPNAPNFPSQLYEDGDGNQGPAIMANKTYDYYQAGFIEEQTPTQLTDKIRNARKELAKVYEQNTADTLRVEYLIKKIQAPDYLEKLKVAHTKLKRNESIIKKAGEYCFENLNNCVANKEQAMQRLEEIDRSLLHPEEEKWRIMLRGSNGQQCEIRWEYNSSADGYRIYDTQRRCVGEALAQGLGKLWDAGPYFFMEVDSEDKQKELFWGKYVADGKQLDGYYTRVFKAHFAHIAFKGSILK